MRSAFLALIVLTAGCAPLAPCPKCPPPKPAPETAQYLEFTFDGLPGWPSAGLEREPARVPRRLPAQRRPFAAVRSRGGGAT